MRFFNTAGPVNAQDHYCLPPLERFNLDDILLLIAQKKYFLLHAPRQTGKTSCLLALAEHLNQTGQYRALYVNIEPAQAARENVEQGMASVVSSIALAAEHQLGEAEIQALAQKILSAQTGLSALQTFLSTWCAASPRPIVLLLDEVDALVGDTLISLLRQLRAGYSDRPARFPQTIVLCGVRDLRDYRIHSAVERAVITGGSAFNIKAESLRLGDFTQAEVGALYQQHTAETGQTFTPEALAVAWELTRGQPWLVNALAYEITYKIKAGRDHTHPITREMFQEAKENLILRRETHLDQLADKLREERVRRVILPLLTGEAHSDQIPTDDLSYVRDLGLIRIEGQIAIANPIYQEVIPRELTYSTQVTLPQQPAWYILPDGRLDLAGLLAAFQQFFRENADAWLEQFDYKEAGPQLLLQAFLQRIINGGGRVEREYGLGRKRTDLLVLWKVDTGVQRAVIELKLLRGALDRTISDGLAQTWEYADRCGASEAHLVLFDRTPGKSWEERIYRRQETFNSFPIHVWGM